MKNITIIGAGTMGNGITHTFAQNNFNVRLVDISNEKLDNAIETISKNLDRMIKKEKITENDKKSTLDNINTFTDLKEGVKGSDLVVEAATENIELKLKIFKQLEDICDSNTILASNTSSISITKIASATKRQEKVIGMHFMNPVPIMKLVEIIKGNATSNHTLDFIINISKEINKIPIMCNDSPGFVSNRILMPMINEAAYTYMEGVADVESIDQIMKLGMGHPMGPLKLADLIGIDICVNIMQVLLDGFKNKKYNICPLLIDMVNNGKLGVKSGEGFYKYN